MKTIFHRLCSILGLCLAFSLTPSAFAQTLPSTTYTRGLLRATNESNAQALLGLVSTNQTTIASPAAANVNMGGFSVTNAGAFTGGSLTATGAVTAGSFVGDGAGLTNLPVPTYAESTNIATGVFTEQYALTRTTNEVWLTPSPTAVANNAATNCTSFENFLFGTISLDASVYYTTNNCDFYFWLPGNADVANSNIFLTLYALDSMNSVSNVVLYVDMDDANPIRFGSFNASSGLYATTNTFAADGAGYRFNTIAIPLTPFYGISTCFKTNGWNCVRIYRDGSSASDTITSPLNLWRSKLEYLSR
jgi:hypothetical protein